MDKITCWYKYSKNEGDYVFNHIEPDWVDSEKPLPFKPEFREQNDWKSHNWRKEYKLMNDYVVEDLHSDKQPYMDAINTLCEYSNIEYNCDGYNGVKPNSNTLNNALILLNKLSDCVDTPKLMISSSGNIGFYYRSDETYIEIEISENGYSVMIVLGKTILYSEERSVDLLDEVVLNHIKNINE